ncbi:unnamed protein product [Calicophoron daubneyi]|uniref:Uncharacterized protein n=1 Tax=Calicophoron daubneyi TaxID=300641 RepID=A0AAV2T9F8_CALDB
MSDCVLLNYNGILIAPQVLELRADGPAALPLVNQSTLTSNIIVGYGPGYSMTALPFLARIHAIILHSHTHTHTHTMYSRELHGNFCIFSSTILTYIIGFVLGFECFPLPPSSSYALMKG